MKPTNEQLEELSAYLDGELPPPERAMVESQLSANAGLRGELESLRRTVDSVRGLPRVKAPAGVADEVLDRLARRELLDERGSRGGEVTRFVVHLRRFAIAAMLLLAAGVGWRYWSTSTKEPVIGNLAAPTVGIPGAARSTPESAGRADAPVEGLAKTELALRAQDRDATGLKERTEPAAGEEKLAFGNRLPGDALALDTRAKAMGAGDGGPRRFSTRADPMLPIATSSAPASTRNESATLGWCKSTGTPKPDSFDIKLSNLEAETNATRAMIDLADYQLSVTVTDPVVYEAVTKALDSELATQQSSISGPVFDPSPLAPVRWNDFVSVPAGTMELKYSFYPIRVEREKACRLFEIIKRSSGNSTIRIERTSEPLNATEVDNCDHLEKLVFATNAQPPIPDQIVVIRTIGQLLNPVPTTGSAPIAP